MCLLAGILFSSFLYMETYISAVFKMGICMLAVGIGFSVVGFGMAWKQRDIMEFLIRQTQPEENTEDSPTNEILRKRMELAQLQSQINPHFLYNTLDSIRGEALVKGQPQIAQMTEHLSRFFRYCISGQGSIVKLSEEIAHVEDYFYVQKYRFGEKLDLKIEMKDESLYEYYLPKVTLQPIVENAIVHGLETVRTGGMVKICVEATQQNLYLRVLDNGKGIELGTLKKLNERIRNNLVDISVSGNRHVGIAVQNVNSRIRICFGEDYGLVLRSVLGYGTEVEITLPLIDDFNRESFEEKIQFL